MSQKYHPAQYAYFGLMALFLVAVSPVLLVLYPIGRLAVYIAARLGVEL